jgi:hypothetical protein
VDVGEKSAPLVTYLLADPLSKQSAYFAFPIFKWSQIEKQGYHIFCLFFCRFLNVLMNLS